jgi:hypothetical protein
MRILNSVDQARFDRRVAELVNDGMKTDDAKKRAGVEIGRERAKVRARIKALGGDWKDQIVTRRAC